MHFFQKKSFQKSLTIVCSFIFFLFLIGYFIYKKDQNKPEPKEWIGFFEYRKNFRDLGQSLNQCVGKEIFRENLIYRSNRYFSGWPCSQIGNPDAIYSLNFNPDKPKNFYCNKEDNIKLMAQHTNQDFVITNIEDLTKWEEEGFRTALCTLFHETIDDMIARRSFLFHCDIGRDRTGAFATMLTMALLEQKDMLTPTFEEAINCDYLKTRQMTKNKVEKAKNLIKDLKDVGGSSKFLEEHCGINKNELKAAAEVFIQ